MRWSVGRTQSTALGTALYRVAEAVLFGGTWILRVSGRNGRCGRGRGPGSGLLVVMTVKRPSAKRPSRRRGEMIRLAYVLRCLPTRVHKEAEKTRQLVWCEGVWHKERRQVGRSAFRRPSPMYEQPRHPTFSSVVDGTFCTKIFDRRTGGGRGTLSLVIDNAQQWKTRGGREKTAAAFRRLHHMGRTYCTSFPPDRRARNIMRAPTRSYS